LLSLSDLLGDEQYVFYISNTAEVQSEILKNFNLSLARVSLKDRTNYGFGVFNYSGRRYDIRASDEYFYERVFGGYISLIYPFSSFQRLEAEMDIANSDKELFGSFITRKSLLVTNTISFVHDNAIWVVTGPVDGSRFRLLLGYTSDVKYSNVNYYSLIADYRKYFRLGLRSSLAARAAIFINDGKEARRYFAGGSWDLRGWDRWSIRGEKMWLSSIELRFPLVDQFTINFPFFGLSFFQIRGAVFFDAGAAWDKDYKETLGSIGAGIRINIFNAFALRYDIGKKIEKDFTQLQPGLFYQFFFGWDF
ncbi:MAG: BamA/TamA family outer membrane protein, partial [Ignavibacteriales bacterium]|nr:BamA/TamA family outer membrane protein [Ignavibacteriales bacterium]